MALTLRAIGTDDDGVGDPEACDATPEPESLSPRLLEAYRRYNSAYAGARPGTLSAVELARARMDLTLLLLLMAEEDGTPLAPDVLDQLRRDAQTLLDVTTALPESDPAT